MARLPETEYRPDVFVHPGDHLQELLEEQGMTQVELARRTGRPIKTINEIVKGRISITTETALQLERVFGVPAHFWVNLEKNYQEYLARIKEHQRLKSQIGWLQKLPVKEMMQWGWIEKRNSETEQVDELLSFFGVSSKKSWTEVYAVPQSAYRLSASFKVDKLALASWLRQGELTAMEINCQPFNRDRFLDALSEIRKLTVEPPHVYQDRIRELCASAGVAAVFIPELPNTRVSGATRWLSPTKALIQLSLRYKADDHLWFTFFHESGHILRHGKKLVFIDGDEKRGNKKGDMEEEANRFASSFLIPDDKYHVFIAAKDFSCTNIKLFAKELEIAPGIVVGRLQHNGHLDYSKCNSLKRRLVWGSPEVSVQ